MFGFGSRKPWPSQLATPAYQSRSTSMAGTSMDYVTVADGTTVAVPRANLAAAKALHAARKAAERRVALGQAPQRRAVVVITELPVIVREERMAS